MQHIRLQLYNAQDRYFGVKNFRDRLTAQAKYLLENHESMVGYDRIGHLISLQNQILGLGNFDESLRKVKFLCYELESHLSQPMSDYHRAEVLRSLIFDRWGFRASRQSPISDRLVISKVVESRIGHPIVLNMLFCELSSHLNLKIECVEIANALFSKVRISGENHYLDMNNCGKYLDCEDLLNILREDENEADSFKSMTIVEVVHKWMYLHSHYFSGQINSERMLVIYDCFLALAPQNLKVLARRGRLLFDMQEERLAWLDLKRYFLLSDPSKTPDHVKSIYFYLKNKFDPVISPTQLM